MHKKILYREIRVSAKGFDGRTGIIVLVSGRSKEALGGRGTAGHQRIARRRAGQEGA